MAHIPPCVGTFERNHSTCNGDPRGTCAEDLAPCAWRNRCAGLQIYCDREGKLPEVVVASLAFDRFVDLCEGYVEKFQITEGISTGDGEEKAPPEPQPKAPPADPPAPPSKRPEKAPSQRNNRKPAKPKGKLPRELTALQAHFAQCLKDRFPGRRFASGKRVLVKPGIFYPVDRVEGSHYISWYCTARTGQDIALACVRFKPRLNCVDIGLPVEPDELKAFLGEERFKRLQVKPYKTGQFLSLCTKLDMEGAALVAEAVHSLVETDVIALP
jgi:hypothetical protein